MATKPKRRLLSALLISVFSSMLSNAGTVSVPEPNEAIKKANYVAIGKLVERNKKVFFVPSEVCKGGSAKTEIEVEPIILGELIEPSYLLKLSGGNEIVVIGNKSKSDGKFTPIFGISSVWPQGVTKEYFKKANLKDAKSAAREITKKQAAENDSNDSTEKTK